MAGGQTLVAASCGDTVKIFDTSIDSGGDPCTLQYTPSPGSSVNSLKWNHTNLVVASAGDDRKISLWRKNGQHLGTLPSSSGDFRDSIDDTILSISFTNKSSRYLCSGGGEVVKIWDLQRKRCIKRLIGHTGTITGVICTCKDEHLASISEKGDTILHNLASGARVADLKDPHAQVLRVIDNSRISRHLLVTAGDDGSIHLWDTNGRNRKVSWVKQHSAPITGVCFSPTNDKIVTSAGLDKKIYTFDSGSKRSSSSILYDVPFSSLTFKDDGRMLAAGTNNGCIVFYDVRGKLQPVTVLRAYSSSGAVTSLSWQRSKPMIVNENTSTSESALLGDSGEDSVLIPDPLPSSSSGPSTASDSRNLIGSSGLKAGGTLMSSLEETPQRNHLFPGGPLSKLKATHNDYSFKDDMEVFSPLVDVQPVTPSLWWADHDEATRDHPPVDKKRTSLAASTLPKQYSYIDDGTLELPSASDLKSESSSREDDVKTTSSQSVAPFISSKSEQFNSVTPPEDWGADGIPDITRRHRQAATSVHPGPSLYGSKLTSAFSVTSDSSLVNPSGLNHLPSTNSNLTQVQGQEFSGREMPMGFDSSTSISSFLGKTVPGQSNYDSQVSSTANIFRKSTYLERISTSHPFSDGVPSTVSSPKSKKTGVETREELVNSLLSKAGMASGNATATETVSQQRPQKNPQLYEQLGAPSFILQLVQQTLEDKLEALNRAVHEDIMNLHIEVLRQSHMMETKMTSLIQAVVENQVETTKKVDSLQKEVQQLRRLL